MKPHRILKSFKGVQDGHHDHHEFVPGPNPVMLSKGLAAIVVREGWAEPLHGKDTAVLPSPLADATQAVPTGEEKTVEAAPENKMKKPVKGKK